MTDKNYARKHFKSVRNSISLSEKNEFDKRIFTAFINSELFNSYDLFLIYVSVGSEVDTTNIIEFLLRKNKRVAVPYCADRDMFFYEIKSVDELQTGKFGIPTVNADVSENLCDFSDAICIVPGLAFDSFGNRMGYGGGYYDRFLSSHSVKSVGLCYGRCFNRLIPHEEYDRRVDYIITESFFKKL